MAAFMPTPTTNRPWNIYATPTATTTDVWPFFSSNDPAPLYRSKRAKWLERAETFKERKARLARELTKAAIRLRKLLTAEPLSERLYDRVLRAGRTVGLDSRYRVMLC